MRKYGLYCKGAMILTTIAKNEREARKHFRALLEVKTLHGYEVAPTLGWWYEDTEIV